uniref:Cysteine-rich receptor-like protein kinase 25 n=1 Tax=Anthurium amnicola TaxID=1678845 RepID=A0A1D1YUR0_9ARAE
MMKPRSFLENLVKPFRRSRKASQEEDLESIAAKEQKNFPYDVLAAATRNFSAKHKLGEGGFGPVYKGRLEDGREVAVKKLSRGSRQGAKEFMNEAMLLSRVQHKNVVNLYGYCTASPSSSTLSSGDGYQEKLLVYEYVPHESLDKLLFQAEKRKELDWKKRHDIILGVARGLLYLHEDAHTTIIHRDIKASNILLDDKWAPKIADFGMARLFPEDQTHVKTRVAGTNGYMAPEYVMHGQLSTKADVFSFGVLVLELISGQKNAIFTPQPDAQCLLEWVSKFTMISWLFWSLWNCMVLHDFTSFLVKDDVFLTHLMYFSHHYPRDNGPSH